MRKYILLFLTALFMAGHADAQLKAGNKMYDRMAYATAVKKYERAVKKNDASVDAWTKLGDSYRLMGDYKNAERAYERVANGPVQAETYLYYAEALMQNEKYSDAKTWLEKYKTLTPGDARATNLLAGIEQLPVLRTMTDIYKVTKTNINTDASEMSPVIFNGGIAFSSDRSKVSWVKKTHAWTETPFYNLYHAKGQGVNFQKATALSASLATKLHDGPVSFSKTGTQMYFTRNNIEDGKLMKGSDGITRLKIFYSNFSGGEWGIEIPFPYNSDDYSCMHPSLSNDGKTLYFASDMPGGAGGMDIWKSEWNGASWNQPVNLGSSINTRGNEVFPFAANDGTLYFSSDGLPGIGGLDIFYADFTSGGKPQNMGIPMNSPGDDFGICVGSTNEYGYFSSNRNNKSDNDDVYYFTKKCVHVEVLVKDETSGELLPNTQVVIMENGSEKQVVMTDSTARLSACLNPLRTYDFIARRDSYSENRATLSGKDISTNEEGATKKVDVVLRKKIANAGGKISNTDTKEPRVNAPVTLINLTTGDEEVAMTDGNGNFNFDNLDLNCDYELRASYEGCGELQEKFNTHDIEGTKNFNFDLNLICKGAIIAIENIYYDYNKSDIRSDAAMELDKLVEFLNQNPSMKIELRSHTDSRGNDSYNLKLSDQRAKAAMAYIISKGVDSSRLTAKGYGETQLLNQCKNGVECSEEEHEVNRRTEFKILEM